MGLLDLGCEGVSGRAQNLVLRLDCGPPDQGDAVLDGILCPTYRRCRA